MGYRALYGGHGLLGGFSLHVMEMSFSDEGLCRSFNFLSTKLFDGHVSVSDDDVMYVDVMSGRTQPGMHSPMREEIVSDWVYFISDITLVEKMIHEIVIVHDCSLRGLFG
jgi:hypothetical protein